ncbi:hypothetical protein TNCT_728331 [Trichonephila clavata]|uniref:Uncharacterized protein n=1 Tax=Trichonephila clavata TaxID=2740835 RepID=A0A8X6LCG0_TRICU|nr:hypothetical protein TNCT_728331 [Trichonephila clavata]
MAVSRDDGPICCEKQVEDALMPWSEKLPRHQPQYQSDILTEKSYLRDISGSSPLRRHSVGRGTAALVFRLEGTWFPALGRAFLETPVVPTMIVSSSFPAV